MGGVILLVLALAFMIFWCNQFIVLMLRSDADFPGRFDKLIWALAFFFMFFLAPFAFAAYKQIRLSMRAAETELKGEEHPHL